MPTKTKAAIHKNIQMQKYDIAEFFGSYHRNSTSPNTYNCQEIDRSIIVRCRTNPQPQQAKYYLVGKVGKGKSFYLSALWIHSTTNPKLTQYKVTDTQKAMGIVELDMFCLTLKRP